MAYRGRALCALAATIVVAACPLGASAASAASPPGGTNLAASSDAERLLSWVLRSKDNAGLPFAVVDKKAATIAVFSPRGRQLASSPVLLGASAGDTAVPGLGALDPARIPVADRTTPAGRYASRPGKNLAMEDVVWIDYDAGLAIHRLRGGRLEAGRQRRLADAEVAGRHASAGCVVVPVAFFLSVVDRVLGAGRGVVYVLPEIETLTRYFPAVGSLPGGDD